MRSTRIASMLALLLLASVENARAAGSTFTTPFVVSASVAICAVTNLSTKPITVSGKLVGLAGDVLTPTTDTCNGTSLLPNRTCSIIGVVPNDTDQITGFFCSLVSSSKKIRGIGYGLTANNSAIVVPATAK
jgi:hypothetical protein